EVRSHAEEIHDQFADRDGFDVTVDEIEERLDTFVNDYHVPIEEARQTVTNNYYDQTESDPELLRENNEHRDIRTINPTAAGVDITGKVVELWESDADAVGQVGLMGDETGRIKFTAWAKSDLDTLEEGAVYQLENVVTGEYQGRYSVKLNSNTRVTPSDETIEVGDNTTEVEGALVAIQSGSGLIKRCPHDDCTRVLNDGRCSEHGEGEGEFDLRVKGVLDDGYDVEEVIFNQEMTEDLAGSTLAEAKERAMDTLDTAVVGDDIRADIIGGYYRVAGPKLGRYVLVDEFERLGTRGDADEILIQARSL